MKVVHSSMFRALCAIIVGVLLIQYREQTVTWITIAIGVLFFLSGVISLASYYSAKRAAEKMQGQVLYDSNGKPLMGIVPKFPLVGVGSVVLGIILAAMPNMFISWLMFILSAILVMVRLPRWRILLWLPVWGAWASSTGLCLLSSFCWACLPSSSLQPLPQPLCLSSDGR